MFFPLWHGATYSRNRGCGFLVVVVTVVNSFNTYGFSFSLTLTLITVMGSSARMLTLTTIKSWFFFFHPHVNSYKLLEDLLCTCTHDAVQARVVGDSLPPTFSDGT